MAAECGAKCAQGVRVNGLEGFRGTRSYLAHYTLPVPSSGPFVHLKLRTSNIATAIPSFGGTPPSPPRITDSSQEIFATLLVKFYPTPPSSHSNIPSPANSMSPATPVVGLATQIFCQLIILWLVVHPRNTPSWPYPIFTCQRHGLLSFDKPVLRLTMLLGGHNCMHQ